MWVTEAMQNVRDNNPKMTQDEVNSYLQYYFMVKRPAENAEASKAWLEKIEKKSGVQKTESGLLYKVTKAGDERLKAVDSRDVVKVHYTGRTRDGKVFDTSLFKNRSKEQQEMLKQQNPEGYDQDEPIEFPLNRVIAGWTEGMKLVGKGGKITLWIPAELAYGARGAGRDIGPNEALEFEVELIDVTPYQAPEPENAEEAAIDAFDATEKNKFIRTTALPVDIELSDRLQIKQAVAFCGFRKNRYFCALHTDYTESVSLFSGYECRKFEVKGISEHLFHVVPLVGMGVGLLLI